MRPVELARKIHGQFWDHKLPLNPVEIAQRLGLRVFVSDIEESGLYDADESKIIIKEHDSVYRQRFSICHEIGHHVLGHGSSQRKATHSFNKKNYILEEFEANAFAAELLMPEAAVRIMIQRGLRFDELCETFGVSKEAMRIRLETLGYL